jgi:hypothetical protein
MITHAFLSNLTVPLLESSSTRPLVAALDSAATSTTRMTAGQLIVLHRFMRNGSRPAYGKPSFDVVAPYWPVTNIFVMNNANDSATSF